MNPKNNNYIWNYLVQFFCAAPGKCETSQSFGCQGFNSHLYVLIMTKLE